MMNTDEEPSLSPKQQRDLRAAELRTFSTALITAAELAPDRMTMAQLTFFLFAAMADLRGTPATFSEIRDAAGPRMRKSLHTTYKILLDGNRRSDRADTPGVGWLRREEDPSDNRRKFLRLTDRGRGIVRAIVNAQTEGQHS